MPDKNDQADVHYLVTLHYLQKQNRPEVKHDYWIYPKGYNFQVTETEAKELYKHKGLMMDAMIKNEESNTIRAFIGKISRIHGNPKWLSQHKHLAWTRFWNPGKQQLAAWGNYQRTINKKRKRRGKEPGKTHERN